MPSLLCSSQILVGWELGQSIPTVFHTVPELSLWTEEIEWSHPSTMSSYSVIPFNIQRNWIWISSNGRYYSSILILDWFLEAMLVPGPPPFMSERKKGSWVWLWYSIFMNYSIGKECYVFISFNIRPYNGKLQSLVTPLPFRDFWWNWISLVSSWNERGQWNYETTRHNQWTLLIRTVEFLVSNGLNIN